MQRPLDTILFAAIMSSAWQYTKRGRLSQTLELADVPVPEPGAGDVVIAIKAVALNPVEEQLAQAPTWLARFMGVASVGTGPLVPCQDFAGTISAVGAGVTEYAAGDDVFGMRFAGDGNGALRTHLCIPASSPFIHRPASLSVVHAAAVPLAYMTVYDALVVHGRLPLRASPGGPRRSVFVQGGSSGTGAAAIQLAKAMGLAVVTSCSTKNVEFVRQLGADEVIDYTREHVPHQALTSPHAPYAVVLDCVGGTDLVDHIDHLILRDPDAPRLGIYVTIVGDKTGRDSMGGSITNYFYPAQALRTLRGKLADVPYLPLKSVLSGPRYACIMLEGTKAKLATAEDVIKVSGPPPIDSTWAYADAKKAFEKLESARARGKIVITLD
ncbi:hypothetical protein Q5752_004072 [Cryptotrichosporon argae]